MFNKSAFYYDLIYSSMKDYEQECQEIVSLIRHYHPQARSVLDVGCGTGEHARLLSEQYDFDINGLDIEYDFVHIARQKLPNLQFFQADMCDFKLARTYDILLCLFSSIGYVKTLAHLKRALSCFKNHLSSNGIMMIEPWFFPHQWNPPKSYMHTAEKDDISVCRMSHSSSAGSISVLQFEYLIGTHNGIEHFSEIHELGLFTQQEIENCFRDIGLEPEFITNGYSGKGLFIAQIR